MKKILAIICLFLPIFIVGCESEYEDGGVGGEFLGSVFKFAILFAGLYAAGMAVSNHWDWNIGDFVPDFSSHTILVVFCVIVGIIMLIALCALL